MVYFELKNNATSTLLAVSRLTASKRHTFIVWQDFVIAINLLHTIYIELEFSMNLNLSATLPQTL